MSKHTPGPWVAQRDPSGISSDWVVGIEGRRIDEIAVCDEQNARLIAAAPELLGALIVVLSNNESLIGASAARAAIAKATGTGDE